jgi:hypothetical protein
MAFRRVDRSDLPRLRDGVALQITDVMEEGHLLEKVVLV